MFTINKALQLLASSLILVSVFSTSVNANASSRNPSFCKNFSSVTNINRFSRTVASFNFVVKLCYNANSKVISTEFITRNAKSDTAMGFYGKINTSSYRYAYNGKNVFSTSVNTIFSVSECFYGVGCISSSTHRIVFNGDINGKGGFTFFAKA